MKRYLFLFICIILCIFMMSCDSDTPEITTAADSNSAVYNTVRPVEIEPNEEVIEINSNAWSVKYLEYPEDIMPFHMLDPAMVYYDTDDKRIKFPYVAGFRDTESKIGYVTSRKKYAIYDTKGNYLGSDEVPEPEDKKIFRYELTDYGYLAEFENRVKENTETNKEKIKYNTTTNQGLLKYYKSTDEYEVIFEDMKEYNDGEYIPNVKMAEAPDGNYCFIGIVKGEYEGKEVWMSAVTVIAPDGEIVFKNNYHINLIDIVINNDRAYFRDAHGYYWTADTENNELVIVAYPDVPEQFGSEYLTYSPVMGSLIDYTNVGTFNVSITGETYRMFGEGQELYYVYNDGIYGQTGDEIKSVVDFSNSGLSLDMITVYKIPSEAFMIGEVFNIFAEGTTAWRRVSAIIYYDTDKSAQEKKTVTLAHTSVLPQDVRTAITFFNMTNAEYRIKTVDYSNLDTVETPNGAAEQLMKEFGMGKFPDLVYLDDDLDYNNLTSKGFMYNLYDLGFTPDSIPKNVRTVCEYGGGLYKLPMTFTYTTLMTKDGTSSLSLTDLISQYKTHGNKLIPQLDRDALLDYLIKAGALGKFIDYANAKCDFNNPEFVSFIEFLRTYNNVPEISILRPHYDLGNLECQQLVKGGDAVYFMASSHHRSASLPVYSFLYDGANYTYCGFPTTYGSGIVIETDYEFGITKASANPDGALEFLRVMFEGEESDTYFWTENLRTNTDILMSRLKSYISHEEYLQYYDTGSNRIMQFEKRGKENAFDEFYGNPERYIIPEVSDDELEYFIEAILNAEVRSDEDSGLLDILYDELTPYLAGQDTASNTANRINSRVGIYLAERYG